jgi:cytidine deaminase
MVKTNEEEIIMDKKITKMLKMAKKARANAYAPYSKFKVGACILTKKGKFYAGANAENSAYPEGVCAEAGAISAMITAGDREIEAVVIIGPKHKVITPCGGCRQKLAEFAKKDVPVYLFDEDKEVKEVKEITVGELLPEGFKLNEK